MQSTTSLAGSALSRFRAVQQRACTACAERPAQGEVGMRERDAPGFLRVWLPDQDLAHVRRWQARKVQAAA